MTSNELDEIIWDYRNRLAVEAVLLDYCEKVDALDYQGIADLFTEDGEFDLGFGRVSRGREGVFKQMSSRMPVEYTHTSHHLSNIRIRFDDHEPCPFHFIRRLQLGDARRVGSLQSRSEHQQTGRAPARPSSVERRD